MPTRGTGSSRWKRWEKTLDKLLVTQMPVKGVPCILCAWIEDGKTAEISFSPLDQTDILGNIYVGQVERVLPNIQGAFVRIEKKRFCFYSLREQNQAVYTNGKQAVNGHYALKAGDQLLIQVVCEQMRGKRPTVTSKLAFSGKYLVLVAANSYLRLSRKLAGDDRVRLRELLEAESSEDYGIIVRTNAGQADPANILRDLATLKKRFYEVLEKGRSRVSGSLVEEAQPFYLNAIRDAYTDRLEEIVTDVPEIYENIRTYLEAYQPEDLHWLRLYRDKLLPLRKLYGLEHTLSEIQKNRVWLKSGGFLVIEQTEAFVSVDVNTGRYVSDRGSQETYRKINLEAAGEIAAQLRLRNLSGIILVDFINLNRPDDEEELMRVFQEHLKKDSVKAKVVDMTALKIVEVTRQKVRRPISEDFQALEADAEPERKKL